jgi:hypothetical protein
MNETIDTSSKYDTSIPDGEREFRVEKIDRKEKGTTVMFIWQVSFDGDGEQEVGEQVLLPSFMGDLLRVLGCEETKRNRFQWDRDILVGKYFIATVSREPDKKDPTKIRQQMGGFKKSEKNSDDIPF